MIGSRTWNRHSCFCFLFKWSETMIIGFVEGFRMKLYPVLRRPESGILILITYSGTVMRWRRRPKIPSRRTDCTEAPASITYNSISRRQIKMTDNSITWNGDLLPLVMLSKYTESSFYFEDNVYYLLFPNMLMYIIFLRHL